MANHADQSLKACYFPAFEDAEDLERYRAQADWYLAPLKDTISIDFPENKDSLVMESKAADVVLFWQKAAFWTAPAALRRKGLIVDEYAQQAVGDGLDRFVAHKAALDITTESERFFQAVNGKYPDIPSIIIIGSGPSVSALKDAPKDILKSALSIYLSTAILNEDICGICPPDIIIAVDGPSQFGHCETAQRYRDRAVDLIRKHQSCFLIPAQHLPSVRTHWPQDTQKYIFAVPMMRQEGHGHRFADDWSYEPTSNVLTSFGLPCAASLSDKVYFAGISLTRQKNNDEGHWEHEDEALYQRHIAPMLTSHPASGQEVENYVPKHHARLQRELAAYAAEGLTFADIETGDISIAAQRGTNNIRKVLPLRVRFFEAIARAQHYPGLVTFLSFIIAGLLGAALQYSIGIRMTGFFIAGGVATFLIAGLLFLRLRMNRMTARLETKLSQQQAQQFANLSERLEALERKK